MTSYQRRLKEIKTLKVENDLLRNRVRKALLFHSEYDILKGVEIVKHLGSGKVFEEVK